MKTKLLILIGGLILLSAVYAQAQIIPMQTQYILNPYIYNPALAGQSGFTSINVGFKKQWWGIEGSPTVISAGFEHPFNDKLAIASQLVNYSEGPLNQLQFMGTLSYRLRLDYDAKQHLSFGMSWGLRSSFLDMTKLDNPNDPALALIAENQLRLDGAFGLSYQYDKFQIGVVAPNLTTSSTFSEDNFAPLEFRPWEQLILIGSYEFHVDYMEEWKLRPIVLFHYNQNFEHQWEGVLTASYSDVFWAGASYRKDFGTTLLAGARINDKFDLSYGYSFSSVNANLPNDSHELTLRLNLGSNKRDKTKTDKIEKVVNTDSEVANNQPPSIIPAEPEENIPDILKVDSSISLEGYDENIDVHLQLDPSKIFGRNLSRDIFDVKEGNYIFIDTYRYISDGRDEFYNLKYKGFTPNFVYDSAAKVYYLYLIAKDDYDDARRIVLKLRTLEPYKDMKILILEK